MQIHEFFLMLAVLMLAVLLLTARLFSEASARLGVPGVIGELAAGLVLGPSLLGWVSPDATMKLLAEIGVILLLFEVGMDTDVFRLAQTGAKPVLVAVGGVLLPAAGGFAVARYGFDLSLIAALFMAGTLTATSIGITVRVLSDLKRRHSREAQIVLGAAVLDDILGVLLLAFLYDFSIKGETSIADTANVAGYILLFMVLGPFLAKLVASLIDHFDQHAASPGLLVTLVLALILFMSWLAHAVGAPEILGGFAAGLALGQGFRASIAQRLRLPYASLLNRLLRENPALTRRLEEQIRPLIHTFTPLFFVMVGVSLNLREVDWGSGFIWALGLSLLLVAFVGKWLAGFCAREPRLTQSAIGLAMVPRGEVGLIFAQLGLNNGVLDSQLYAALLIVIALTTALPPFLMKAFYRRYGPRLPVDA